LPPIFAAWWDISDDLKRNLTKAENKPDMIHFANKLMLHAQTEEQVLYPAAILVGEVVRSKL
jgi:hypothetical protein